MLAPFSYRFLAMGSDCAFSIYAADPSRAAIAIDRAMGEIQRIEARYSRYRIDSELSRINAVARVGGSVIVDDESAALLDYATTAYRRSGGLFDITSGLLREAWNFRSGQLPAREAIDRLLPRVGMEKLRWERPTLSFDRAGMELDLGGLGKEYAADRAAAMLIAEGISHGLVELGGDIRVVGPHPDGTPWHIGIRDPLCRDRLGASAFLSEGGLATSGDYERCIRVDGRRYGHILHPATGWPVSGLSSVSIIAGDCLLAGTLATIAMLKANSDPTWLDRLTVPRLRIDEEGRVTASHWPGSLSSTARAA